MVRDSRLASPALDRSRAVSQQRRKKQYKIVLEDVTQEKKKLRSIVTFTSDAPANFGFIPAGHPKFTEWCREQCRLRNFDVHIVSAKPSKKAHEDPQMISHHVHRIGHHFPLTIIEAACSKFGYTFNHESGLTKNGQRPVKGYGPKWFEREIEDYNYRMQIRGSATETKDYIRGAIRELFPLIPAQDLEAVLYHAFKEGKGRVGTKRNVGLARRVQLAVTAHIRHNYTDYDDLLHHFNSRDRSTAQRCARRIVESPCLAKLKEWRDETEEQSNELEDTFKEVIHLDDPEDDDYDTEDLSQESSLSSPEAREPNLKIVSSRVNAREIQREPIDRTHPVLHSDMAPPRLFPLDSPRTQYYLPAPPRGPRRDGDEFTFPGAHSQNESGVARSRYTPSSFFSWEQVPQAPRQMRSHENSGIRPPPPPPTAPTRVSQQDIVVPSVEHESGMRPPRTAPVDYSHSQFPNGRDRYMHRFESLREPRPHISPYERPILGNRETMDARDQSGVAIAHRLNGLGRNVLVPLNPDHEHAMSRDRPHRYMPLARGEVLIPLGPRADMYPLGNGDRDSIPRGPRSDRISQTTSGRSRLPPQYYEAFPGGRDPMRSHQMQDRHPPHGEYRRPMR